MSAAAPPIMVVVAGPAGGGKSTVFPLTSFAVDSFSVDDRCAELNGGSYVGISSELRARAGAECRAFIERHITSQASFAVETTLRAKVAIEQAASARANGFRTVMLFLTTEDVRINISRVTARGLMRGHSSPAEEIRSIFDASMANLPHALVVFDRVECFDNTRNGGRPVRVLTFQEGKLVGRASQLPGWATRLVAAEP